MTRTSTRDARRTRAIGLVLLFAAFAAAAACEVCEAAAPADRVAEAEHALVCERCREVRGIYAPPRAVEPPAGITPALRRWMRWWTERNGVWV